MVQKYIHLREIISCSLSTLSTLCLVILAFYKCNKLELSQLSIPPLLVNYLFVQFETSIHGMLHVRMRACSTLRRWAQILDPPCNSNTARSQRLISLQCSAIPYHLYSIKTVPNYIDNVLSLSPWDITSLPLWLITVTYMILACYASNNLLCTFAGHP